MSLSDDAKKRILKMCRKQLSRRNPPDTEALYGRAVRIDRGVREMSLRQFHATFPLRVKRQNTRSEERNEPPENTNSIENSRLEFRTAVRRVLLDFAIEISDTADAVGIIEAWERIDYHVGRILNASRERQ